MGDLSEHFSRHEFDCPCGKLANPKKELIDSLELLRSIWNKPILVTSGFRSVPYNRDIGGVPLSHHLHNRAADIVIRGIDTSVIAKEARKLFNGVGEYRTFVHVDVRRGRKARWKVK